MRLTDVPKDPLSLIAKQFEDPFDINAFENSHPNFKDSVEIYHIYREWERKLMPNDDIRIIATKIYTLYGGFYRILFRKENELILIEETSELFVNITVIQGESFEKIYLKIPFLKLNVQPRLIGYSYSGRNQYGIIILIYTLLLNGFKNDHDYSYLGDLSNLRLKEKKRFPNDKYRILSIFIFATDYEPKFIKNGEIYKLKVKKSQRSVEGIYKLFEKGYIYDNGIRTLQTRISDLTVF